MILFIIKVSEINPDKADNELKTTKSTTYELFKWYCFTGIKAILILCLCRKLMLEVNLVTDHYNVSTSSPMVFFACLFVAIFVVSFIGNFKMILWVSILYAIGNVVITVQSVDNWNLPAVVMTSVGLILIAVGSCCDLWQLMSLWW